MCPLPSPICAGGKCGLQFLLFVTDTGSVRWRFWVSILRYFHFCVLSKYSPGGKVTLLIFFIEKAIRGQGLAGFVDGLRSSQLTWTPTWKVVDVASIHQEVPILWVTERRHIPREGHAGTDVSPQRACRNEREGMVTALNTATEVG